MTSAHNDNVLRDVIGHRAARKAVQPNVGEAVAYYLNPEEENLVVRLFSITARPNPSTVVTLFTALETTQSDDVNVQAMKNCLNWMLHGSAYRLQLDEFDVCHILDVGEINTSSAEQAAPVSITVVKRKLLIDGPFRPTDGGLRESDDDRSFL